ncbi:diguanylate cyclase [Alteromonas sp. ASW11-19]|uniref:diguanylate cyclase n=1 Tax=Alteromonas salexigens TaxID=2982530 RepID=A0ABT2VNA2_9ALTE|nr:GGDEF domain-containing protein [Alteromonas salexigens]MCU7554342.1 diguanylate cyclase [Alteromonas salexigens]
MRKLASFFGLVCLLTVCLAGGVQAASHDDLVAIEALRVSDPVSARVMLDDIDVSALSADEKIHYRYLQVYFSTYDGDLAETLAGYHALLEDARGHHIEVRLLVSLIGLSVYSSEWSQSFALAEKLEAMIPEVDPRSKIDVYRGLTVFHVEIDQHAMARFYIDKILESEEANDAERCIAMAHKAESSYRANSRDLSQQVFEDAIALCQEAEQYFYVAYAGSFYYRYLVMIEDIYMAEEVDKQIAAILKDMDFIHMDTTQQAARARLALLKGDYQQARQLALEVLESDREQEYRPPILKALDVLAKVEKAEGNYQDAVAYLEMKIATRDDYHTAEVARSLAMQRAKFDLSRKESQIALMDQKNKLAAARAEKLYLALILSSVMLFGLLMWSYRSRKVQQKLRHLARTDSLTQIYNRGYFAERAERLLKKTQQQNGVLSVALLDLDHFKQINDTYGHQIGDWVLREVVRAMQAVCDENCMLGRMGGEEFAILITDADAQQGLAVAEECREAIEAIDSTPSGHQFTLTASFGVADTRQVGFNFENLSSASDLALYQSKQYGRNRVYEYDSTLKPI